MIVVALPLLLALLCLRVRRPAKLAAALMAAQSGIVVWVCLPGIGLADTNALISWGFRLDATSAFFLILTTLVVTAAMLHAALSPDPEGPFVYGFTALFLLSMYGVVAADDLGLLWICMEASTLLSAPLVYAHRSRTSLEATWKYLIICSVGISFAFFGTAILYGVSQQAPGLAEGSLSLSTLTAHAGALGGPLVRFAFVFMLAGYGTKAGLFPLHSWLPDAHSEAPAMVSAILSGALLNCSLVAIWRVVRVMEAAGQMHFVQACLLPMALLTVVAASLFLVRQHDFKRLWAYSSMENVGVMAVAIALGSAPAFGQQALNHSAAKVALFLLAGGLLRESGSRRLGDVHGYFLSRPAQAALLMLGMLAVSGTPPFGSFVAEWSIVSRAVVSGHFASVAVLLAALAVAFIALSRHVAGMLLGEPTIHGTPPGAATIVVPLALVLGALLLGFLTTPAVLSLQ